GFLLRGDDVSLLVLLRPCSAILLRRCSVMLRPCGVVVGIPEGIQTDLVAGVEGQASGPERTLQRGTGHATPAGGFGDAQNRHENVLYTPGQKSSSSPWSGVQGQVSGKVVRGRRGRARAPTSAARQRSPLRSRACRVRSAATSSLETCP